MIDQIRAYYQATETIATSGQPSEQQFAEIAAAGYQVVINLALSDSTYAIANEQEIVTALGMTYVHIPVNWEDPQIEDVRRFFSAMMQFKGQEVWVHCALNMRVSCFIYLYKKYVLQLPESEARYPMREIWQPSGAWQNLIDAVAEG